MTIRKSLIAAVLIATAAVTGLTVRSQFQKRHRQPAVTLITRVTQVNPSDPSQQYHGEETRYAFSDGSFRVNYKGERGESKEYFFKRGLGFFEINHKRKQLVRDPKMSLDAGGRRPWTADELRANPQFVRTENVLGLTAYVLRVTDERTGLPITDLYFAVETGRTPLKTIDYGSNGNPVAVDEPVKVIFGEPSRSLLEAPDYAVVEGGTQ